METPLSLSVLSAPARWPACSLAYVKARHARAALEQATTRTYLAAPVLRGDVLSAQLRVGTAPGEPAHHVSITVRRAPRRTLLQCTCSCERGTCVHVLALLEDLSTWPEFARAVMAGRDTGAMLQGLQARRAGAREDTAVREVLGRWLDVPRARPAVAVRFMVWPRWLGTRAFGGGPDEDAVPALEVHALLDGRKTALAPRDLADAPISPADRALLDLCHPPSGFSSDHLVASGGSAARLLGLLESRPVMLGSPRGTSRALRFEELHLVPRIMERRVPRGWLHAPGGDAAEDDPDDDAGTPALVAEWCTVDGSVVSPMARTMFFPGNGARVVLMDRDVVARVAPGVDARLALQLQRHPVVALGPTLTAEVALQALRGAMDGRGVMLPSAGGNAVDRQAGRTWLAVDGTPLDLTLRLVAEYAFGAFDLSPRASPTTDPRRDADAEERALSACNAVPLEWQDRGRVFTATDDDAARFWMHGVRALQDAGVEVRLPPSMAAVRAAPPLSARLSVNVVQGMLEVELVLRSGELRADMEEVRRALRRGRRFVRMADGTLAELQGRVAELLGMAPELVRADAPVRVPRGQWARVHAWLEEIPDAVMGPEAQPWVHAIRTARAAPAEIPTAFTGQLRGYQAEGVAFLQGLTRAGAGGVLADDMGLGKTVQAVAWLAWLREKAGALPFHALVVAPTSVVHTWTDHVARLAPGLRVHTWHGAGRHRGEDLENSDVVVTTYGTLRVDAERLAHTRWDAVLLDEAQVLRNADAVTTRAVARIPAVQRVALSGTPVENRPSDLWTLMDLCNPGLLGPREPFQQVTEPSILREPGGTAAQRVRARVAPFMLRRRKADVLSDLPPRQEQDRLCAPTGLQRRMYDAVAALARADVARMMAKKGHDHARMAVLAALTRLRQVACDPRLVDGTLDAGSGSKRLEFLSLVETVVAEGRRALVFSSFVELLQLWRRDLHALGIRHVYLDGSTTRRDEVVRTFQEGDAPLMLISLKAGGVGLTLTAADTVILCDPWWNPAAEDQAADRAHRIGQSRAVTVYRLITRGTLEERILALKARKRRVADALLGDEGPGASTWDPAEVAPLLLDADGEEEPA